MSDQAQIATPASEAEAAKVAVATVLVAVCVGLLLLNPLWARLSPPFPILRVSPPITAPVDGPYYLQNAQNGYQWSADAHASIWYHPLLSWLVDALPRWLPSNIWFWLVSLVFSVATLVLTYRIINLYLPGQRLPPAVLLTVLIIPGGLEIATGNTEVLTLLFASLLMLSVLDWHLWWLTVLSGALAVLAKPNALYMIPILAVYAVEAFRTNSRRQLYHALVGIAAIVLTFCAWIIFVDFKTGVAGSYWHARSAFANYVGGNPAGLFLKWAESIVYGVDLRDKIRYSTALVIPVINVWIVAITPTERIAHRYALVAGNLAMFALMLWQGNPNKAIVYSTTIPGYFAITAIFTYLLAHGALVKSRVSGLAMNAFTGFYFALMAVVFIAGTPLGWYY